MKDTSELHDFVRTVELFKDLNNEELGKIIKLCSAEKVGNGRIIFQEGSPGDKIYIIVSGEVRISKKIQGIGEEAFAFLRSGDFFGEMSFIDRNPRSAMAVTDEDTKLLTIENSDLDNLLKDEPILANKILWAFCKTFSNRLRQTNEKIRDFLMLSKVV
jgi:CRP-like cAMP-binding protein